MHQLRSVSHFAAALLFFGAVSSRADGFTCSQDLPGLGRPASESLSLRKDPGAETFSLVYSRRDKERETRTAGGQKSGKTVASRLFCRVLPGDKLIAHCSDGANVFFNSKLQEETAVREVEGHVSPAINKSLAIALDVFGPFWPERPDEVIHYTFSFARSKCVLN